MLRDQETQYYEYALHFTEPLSSSLARISNETRLNPSSDNKSFSGDIGMSIGQSAYSSFSKASQFSKNFTANGQLGLGKQRILAAGVNYQQEVIQTPYSMAQAYLGYTQTFINGMSIDTRIGINSYRDKNQQNNNFNGIDGHLNFLFPFRHGNSIYSGIQFNSQKYKITGGSDFSNYGFIVGSNLKPHASGTIKLQLTAAYQNSDQSYLKFNRVNPSVSYTIKTKAQRSFYISGDIESINYTESARSNNYLKSDIILGWSLNVPKKERFSNFTYTKKTFPFNERIDYSRFGFETDGRRNTPLLNKLTTSVFSLDYTYYTLRDTVAMHDFFDLRYLHSHTGRGMFNDFNIFCRIWNDFNFPKKLDDVVDAYFTFGPNINRNNHEGNGLSSLRAGLILGLHILIGGEEDPIKKEGNSGRGGITLQGNYRFSIITLNFSGSYEKSILFNKKISYNPNSGEVTYGDIVNRLPGSLQFNINSRIQAGRSWDIKVDLNYMDIRTGSDATTSINPIREKTRFRFMAGLVYRFNIRMT